MFAAAQILVNKQSKPSNRSIAHSLQVQTAVKVGAANDFFEQEADQVADQVTQTPDSQVQASFLQPRISPVSFLQRMQEEESASEQEEVQPKLFLQRTEEESIQKTPFVQKMQEEESNETEEVQTKSLEHTPTFLQMMEEEEAVQKQSSDSAGSYTSSESLSQRLHSSKGGGSPMSSEARGYMEPRFGADFSGVRIHTGSSAVQMSNELGAKAFAHGNDIYFNEGQYDPNSNSGKHLLAHELTHTIQQGAVIQRKPAISTHASPAIQRISIGSLLNKIARHIPWYTLFTVIIGKNPLTGDAVPRTPTNFIGGFLGLLPGGTVLFDKLKESGALEDMGNWLSKEVDQLGITWSYLKGLIDTIWDEVSVLNSWGTNVNIVKRHLNTPYQRIKRFVLSIANKIKEFIFVGALKLVGAPVETIMGILNQGASILKSIFNNPLGFISNLFKGIGLGLKGFMTRIQKHLMAGLTGWLFGSMSKEGITMPKKFDLKGVFGLVLDLTGVTYPKIRKVLVKRLGRKGETIVRTLEKAFDFLKLLVQKGPMALWEKLMSSLSNLKEMVISGIKDFLITTVIREGIFWLLGLLNPAGALVKVAKMLVNVVLFFIERKQQIIDFAKSVFQAIGKIASGDLKSAAKAVENAIASSLPVMIGFLANLAGLGGLAKTVVGIIRKVGQKVQNVIKKVIDWIVKRGKIIFKKLQLGAKNAKAKLVKWWTLRKKFRNNEGETHTVFFKGKGPKAKLMMASTTMRIEKYLATREQEFARNPGTADQMTALTQAKAAVANILSIMNRPRNATSATKRELDAEIRSLTNALANLGGKRGTKGALAIYRGIHFGTNLDTTTYSQIVNSNMVGEGDVSSHIRRLEENRGSMTPRERRTAIQAVVTQLSKIKRDDEPHFFEMVELYVNNYNQFVTEISAAHSGRYSGHGWLDIPFISTSRNASQAASYALGNKFSSSGVKRSNPSETVGRVFVYLVTVKQLEKAKALDIPALHQKGKIVVSKPEILDEGEHLFPGTVPNGKVAQIDARGGESVGSLNIKANKAAEAEAIREGGLIKT